MTSSQMLHELQRLAEKKEIQTDVALRLMLSAQATMFERMVEMDEKRDVSRDVLKIAVEKLQDKVEDVSKNNQRIIDKLDRIEKNPSIQIGDLISKYPKLTTVFFVLIFVLANLWFISGIRKAIMLAIGFPPEIVEMLAP